MRSVRKRLMCATLLICSTKRATLERKTWWLWSTNRFMLMRCVRMSRKAALNSSLFQTQGLTIELLTSFVCCRCLLTRQDGVALRQAQVREGGSSPGFRAASAARLSCRPVLPPSRCESRAPRDAPTRRTDATCSPRVTSGL